MSDDANVAKDLVETLKDGERGFAAAAEKLRDSDSAQWATTLDRLVEQRIGFRREIVAMGHDYGDDVDESGSAAAALHRWISLKDALTGDDAGSVLGAAGDPVRTMPSPSTTRPSRRTSVQASASWSAASASRSSPRVMRSRPCRSPTDPGLVRLPPITGAGPGPRRRSNAD